VYTFTQAEQAKGTKQLSWRAFNDYALHHL